MFAIRPARPIDEDALYAISLATGHLGGDAHGRYRDPQLLGHIYSAPYLKLAPELAFVAEDRSGVLGFAVGALDTRRYEDRLERDWWPPLRARYADPDPRHRADWDDDERRRSMIHHPERAPEAVVAAYPAHLHINLLPHAQGKGLGVRLLRHWLEQAAALGAGPVHVAVNRGNLRALGFWRRCGFETIDGLPRTRTAWLGREPSPLG